MVSDKGGLQIKIRTIPDAQSLKTLEQKSTYRLSELNITNTGYANINA